jgi:hypothetical protein
VSAELHVTSHDLVVVRLLYFDVQQPVVLRSDRDRGIDVHELVPRVAFGDKAHALQRILLHWL